MKVIRIHGKGDWRVDEIERPQVGPKDVLIKVRACGICGSDLSYIKAGGPAGPGPEPVAIGHELSGTIEEMGAEVQGLRQGQRVVLNPMGDGNAIGNGAPEGGFSPFLLVRNATLGGSIHPIPDDLPFEDAALAEPLAVSMHAARRGEVKPGQKVAIFGAGPIGLGILAFLRRMGVEQVAVVDRSAGRLERARQLGAATVIDASREDVAEALARAHGKGESLGMQTVGTEVFYEVTGAPPVLPSIIAMAPFHARVVMVAVHYEPILTNWLLVLAKEMTITTSMAYPDEFPDVLAALSDPNFDTAPLVSHHFPLDRFEEALAAARDPEGSAKVLVDCGA